MKRRQHFFLTVFSLISLALVLVGCGPSAEEIATQTAAAWTPTSTNTPIPTSTPVPPTATPTPTVEATPMLPSPAVIMEDVIAVWEQVDSFHFEISAKIDAIISGGTISTVMEFSGDFQTPNLLRGTQSVEIFGFALKSEFINIGETTYTKDTITGEWQKDAESLFPFGPEYITDINPTDLENPVLIGLEELEGIRVYHLTGNLTSDRFVKLFGDLEIYPVIEYWISVENNLILQVTIIIESLEGGGDLDSISVLVVGIISNYGQEVNIEAPIP